jgi:hypothetical protein
MMKINQNHMATKIAQLEGGSVNINIAQIKEIMKITLELLAQEIKNNNVEGVIDLIESHKK